MSDCAARSDEGRTASRLDRELIRLTQAGLPLVPRPFRHLAEQLGVEEAEVMARLQAMLTSGVIRRVAAVPNHYRLGYTANGMSVWDVDDAAVVPCGERIGALDFVSHWYQRPRHPPLWPYNLFAMLHGHNREEVMLRADEIGRLLGGHCRGQDILFSTRILKKTGLRIGPNPPPAS